MATFSARKAPPGSSRKTQRRPYLRPRRVYLLSCQRAAAWGGNSRRQPLSAATGTGPSAALGDKAWAEPMAAASIWTVPDCDSDVSLNKVRYVVPSGVGPKRSMSRCALLQEAWATGCQPASAVCLISGMYLWKSGRSRSYQLCAGTFRNRRPHAGRAVLSQCG